MAFSGLVCRANPHCTAESPCYLPRKTPLRRLIFYLPFKHAGFSQFKSLQSGEKKPGITPGS